ncbi:MAG: CopG family transcriptional regulator [Alphaproteobacteria bacterium]|nr:CopG family transcriptional regulator [Alphaproteobacteria bacterium]
MTNKKIRCQVLTDEGLADQIEAYCRRARVTKSDFFNKALKAFFEQRGETEIDRRYCKRLDRFSVDLDQILRELRHVRRDEEMILESFAVFIRFTIALNADKQLPDKAAFAIAHERYLRFVDQVGRHIALGRTPASAKSEKEAL